MDKDDNYSVQTLLPFTAPVPAPSFNASIDYSLDHQQHQQYHHNHEQQEQQFVSSKFRIGAETLGDNNNVMVDYMLNNTQHHQQQAAQPSSAFYGSSYLDKFSFADVMQFADFGPKLALNQTKNSEVESGIDPVYFLKFPVLNDNKSDLNHQNLMANAENEDKLKGVGVDENSRQAREEDRTVLRDDEDVRASSDTNSVQLRFLGEDLQKNSQQESKNKRKRPRTIKTIEEVESQRMTHIAVERNRRKQMNEHLRVLRSLMPGSYVQRGDQASIIGGAIEFVRELEQLLQCLESQKRRRIYGEGAASTRQAGDSSSLVIQQSNQQPPLFPPLPIPNEQMKLAMEFETGLREETAEKKSCFADVEVKLLGFDAMIKILSRRRPGQLIKTIAALEDLQLNILHTNITTIEQTVLYSFNVKVASDSSRFTAEDIASSVQQIFSFIHANSGM